MTDIFISYAKSDFKQAETLRTALVPTTAKVFLAEQSIESGAIWINSILRALDECICVFLIVSEDSCASPYVQQEIGVAIGLKKPIVPMILHPFAGTLPGLVQRYQVLDLAAKTQPQLITKIAELGNDVVKYRLILRSSSPLFPFNLANMLAYKINPNLFNQIPDWLQKER